MVQICKDHWKKMQDKVAELGMDNFVSKTGEEAMEKMVDSLEGTDATPEKVFDPLLNANWAILAQWMHDVGIAGMTYDGCPLCEVESGSAGRAQNWIDGSIGDQLAYAKHHGLIKVN
jgi:hypothetical protein